MRFGKPLLILFAITLSFSCAVRPPNEPVCFEINLDRGGCIKPITGETLEINEASPYQGKTWWEMRPSMIMLPPTTWKAIRSFIIKTCKKTGQCEKEISSWDRVVEDIDSEVNRRSD